MKGAWIPGYCSKGNNSRAIGLSSVQSAEMNGNYIQHVLEQL